MWYFSWVLGLGLACTVAILNAMWLEMDESTAQGAETSSETPVSGTS
jgi:cytochrome bd-I ubiquinol oxidase subunit X